MRTDRGAYMMKHRSKARKSLALLAFSFIRTPGMMGMLPVSNLLSGIQVVHGLIPEQLRTDTRPTLEGLRATLPLFSVALCSTCELRMFGTSLSVSAHP